MGVQSNHESKTGKWGLNEIWGRRHGIPKGMLLLWEGSTSLPRDGDGKEMTFHAEGEEDKGPQIFREQWTVQVKRAIKVLWVGVNLITLWGIG